MVCIMERCESNSKCRISRNYPINYFFNYSNMNVVFITPCFIDGIDKYQLFLCLLGNREIIRVFLSDIREKEKKAILEYNFPLIGYKLVNLKNNVIWAI